MFYYGRSQTCAKVVRTTIISLQVPTSYQQMLAPVCFFKYRLFDFFHAFKMFLYVVQCTQYITTIYHTLYDL